MAKGDKFFAVMSQEKAVPQGVATLDENGILIKKQRPSIGEIGGSNKNMLINSYFANPVNRNGKTEYTEATKYTIDRWKININSKCSISDSCISVENIANTTPNVAIFLQICDFAVQPGETYTLAFLVKSVSGQPLNYRIRIMDSNNAYAGQIVGTNLAPGINRVTGTMPANANYLQVEILASSTGEPGKVELIAAKLELGDQQTLAHQDESGKWVLNEIPNYAEQYVICEQYSLITDEFVGSQHSNPDILDNSYFIGGGSQQGGGQFPINQLGETEYTEIGYTIDRWYTSGNDANSTISLLSDGIQFSAPVAITNFCQSFEDVPISDRDYTFSFLYTSNVPVRPYASKDGVLGYKDFPATDTIQLGLLHFTLSGTGRFYVAIQNREANAIIKLVAAKLELGPVQTLAHKEGDTWVLNDPPPNYALELAKCQRYQYVFNIDTNDYQSYCGMGMADSEKQAVIIVNTPTTMRANPTVKLEGTARLFGLIGNTSASVDVSSLDSTTRNRYSSTNFTVIAKISDGSLTRGYPYILYLADADSSIIFDANL